MRYVVILILFLFQVNAYSSSLTANCPKSHCLAVIDSGSSGTRLLVYAYDMNESSGLPEWIDTIGSYKITPGLTQIPATKSNVSDYLDSLMSQSNIENIPVYYFSTAGMRLQSPKKQHRYYQLISDWFQKKPSLILKEVKTISGIEEGLFGWLAINYQLEAINKPAEHQYGVLDMGGASVQISFPVVDARKANKHIYLNGKPIHLRIESYLGMGQSEMGHQFLNYSYCFSKNYPLPNGRKGRGDWYRCIDRIDNLTNGVHKISNISRYLSYAPPGLSWTAMGGMMFVKKEQPFNFPSDSITLIDYQVQAQQKVCQQDWDDISQQYPQTEYLNLFCLYPAYYYSLIVDGYGFSPTQPIYELPGRVTQGWTMGVVIYSLLNYQ